MLLISHRYIWLVNQQLLVLNLKSHRVLALLFSAAFSAVLQRDLETYNPHEAQMFLYIIPVTWLSFSVYAGPSLHLTSCCVPECLRGIFMQPEPWVLSTVIDICLHGYGTWDLFIPCHGQSLCVLLVLFKPLVLPLDISHFLPPLVFQSICFSSSLSPYVFCLKHFQTRLS